MIQFICLFFPAFISVGIYQKLIETELSLNKFICFYASFNVIVNTVCLFIKRYIIHSADIFLEYENSTLALSIAIRYLLLAITVSIISSVILSLVLKKIIIKIEEDKKTDE